MNVSELIEILQGYEGDAEVRLMLQAHWPFECSIYRVVSSEEILDDDEPARDASAVYIVEGDQIKYGTRTAWRR